MSGAGVATLTEVVLKYVESLSVDLKCFAKHAKRATVGCDDVKLVARKLPELMSV
jgi:histone H3/H4